MKLEEVELDEMETFPLALVAKHRALRLDWLLHAYSRQRNIRELWEKKGWRVPANLEAADDGKNLFLWAVQNELAYYSPEAENVMERISKGDTEAWTDLKKLTGTDD